MTADELALAMINCDARSLIRAWATGDDLAGHIVRYLSSTPDEREEMLREALEHDWAPP